MKLKLFETFLKFLFFFVVSCFSFIYHTLRVFSFCCGGQAAFCYSILNAFISLFWFAKESRELCLFLANYWHNIEILLNTSAFNFFSIFLNLFSLTLPIFRCHKQNRRFYTYDKNKKEHTHAHTLRPQFLETFLLSVTEILFLAHRYYWYYSVRPSSSAVVTLVFISVKKLLFVFSSRLLFSTNNRNTHSRPKRPTNHPTCRPTIHPSDHFRKLLTQTLAS